MLDSKQNKINKEMKKLFAQFIEKESNKESLVTITRCEISPNRKDIDVFVSVFPEDKEEQVIAFLDRRKWDARDYAKNRIKTRIIPFVHFKIDSGEKNRQKIDQLLNKV